MEKPPFPEVIDNTYRKAFAACHQKFYWTALRRQVPDVPSIHLHAGGAFAKGLEMARRAFYEENLSSFQAIAIGREALIEEYGTFDTDFGYLDHAKSCAGMLRAFEDYFFQYSLDHDTLVPITTPDGSRGIEFSFAAPIDILHPVTGNPILYAGRFDMLAVEDGVQWGVDEKTTGSLGESWNKQWDLASQFTGYTWGAHRYGFPIVGFRIRGIGLLKTKITHAQPIIYRPQWMVDRWYKQLLRDVQMMVALWENDPGDGSEFDFDLDAACSSYGACPYKKLCMSPQPEDWVKVGFKTSDWSPLQHKPEE